MHHQSSTGKQHADSTKQAGEDPNSPHDTDADLDTGAVPVEGTSPLGEAPKDESPTSPDSRIAFYIPGNPEPLCIHWSMFNNRPALRDSLMRECRDSRICCVDCERELTSRRRGDNIHPICSLGDSALHRRKCRFSAASRGPHVPVHWEPAVQPIEGGSSVAIKGGLRRNRRYRQERSTSGESKSTESVLHTRRNNLTQLGFLQYCWEKSSLHVYHPRFDGNRGYMAVVKRLTKTCRRLKVDDRPLPQALYIPRPERGAGAHGLDEKLKKLRGNRVILVVGLFRSSAPCSKHPRYVRLNLQCLHASSLVVDRDTFDNATSSFGVPKYCPKSSDLYWVIAKVYRDRHSGLAVADSIAWMRCQRNHIPVQSEFEQTAIDEAVVAGRFFRKPLRYSPKDSPLDTLPDIVFLDVPKVTEFPGEVWGMKGDPIYDTRRIVKHTEKYKGKLWWWDPHAGAPRPPFPPIDRTKRKIAWRHITKPMEKILQILAAAQDRNS